MKLLTLLYTEIGKRTGIFVTIKISTSTGITVSISIDCIKF
jgi:hypothetical protein